MSRFIGRKQELESLKLLLKKKVASFVVIHGRRRIGKSRLIEKFGQLAKFYEFTGLPPTKGTTAQKQRDEFLRQFKEQCGYSTIAASDWGDIFTIIARETATGRAIILLDEISWMGSKDPTFLGKLKVAWDLYFKKNPQLILIVCGSVSSWITKNILSHTGFVGRISLSMQIEEMPLYDCHQLLKKMGCQYPIHEFFKLLGITGGIPRYLEEVQGGLTVNENIKHMCFRPDGFLYREFDQLFSDLFASNKETCKKVLSLLATQELEANEIAYMLGYSHGGYISKVLNELAQAGFVRKTYAWNFKEEKEKKRPRFRLIDHYTRFFLRYIEPNRGKIESGHFKEQTLSAFPGWNTLMGIQFENLVLHNREFIFKSLHLRREDILFDGPYVQKSTKQQKGCQIDYLIHTRYRMLFVCEIKFSQDPITPAVIEEVKQKLEALKVPRGYSCNPILIHVNGIITDRLAEREYFTQMIDFRELI